MVMKNVTKKIQKIPYLFLLMLFSFVTASAQKANHHSFFNCISYHYKYHS